VALKESDLIGHDLLEGNGGYGCWCHQHLRRIRRSFRVVSRSQIQYFLRSRRLLSLVRFPAAPQEGPGQDLLMGSFLSMGQFWARGFSDHDKSFFNYVFERRAGTFRVAWLFDGMIYVYVSERSETL
jgi:hypothetical protein